jgi:RNA polymerase sigma factor (sigma-70 family)
VDGRLCSLTRNRLYADITTDRSYDALNAGTIQNALMRRALSHQAVAAILPLQDMALSLALMDPITVLIADAHALLRQRLSRFLAQQEDIQVIGAAADGRQVLSRVGALRPHILLLDIRMPKMSGLEVLRKILARSPGTKTLILADVFEEEFIARALQPSVQGCLLKTAPPTELVKVIRTAHAGELWAQRKLLTRVVENLRQRLDELQGFLLEVPEVLTAREQEVVTWAEQGMTNKEIATQLGVSEKTVKTHLQNVFRKLKVSRRGQLLRLRLASPPPPAAPPPSALR